MDRNGRTRRHWLAARVWWACWADSTIAVVELNIKRSGRRAAPCSEGHGAKEK